MIRGCDVDNPTKNIERSMVFSGAIGIWSNISFYINPNKWFARMGADISGLTKIKIIGGRV